MLNTENNVAAQAGDEPMQVGWLNVKYGTFFQLAELAASERTTEMLISGEVIRVYSGPGAKWACPDCGNAQRFNHRGCIMSASPRATADVERLDFVLANSAWIQWATHDDTFKRCQLWTQDEDENYIILSGDEKSFATEREAIDAACRHHKARSLKWTAKF